jgi:hypothetical protein
MCILFSMNQIPLVEPVTFFTVRGKEKKKLHVEDVTNCN